MRAVLDIAGVNLVRFVRDRSFVVLAIVAPFLIMTALAGTLGSVFSGQYRPDLVIADEIGGGVLDDFVTSLRNAGFTDLDVVTSADEARELVEAKETDAALIFDDAFAASVFDPAADPAPIQVVANADADVASAVAASLADQSRRSFDTVRVLAALDAPTDDLSGRIAVTETTTSVRVLTDGTYFAVAMAAYFTVFAAASLVGTLHSERRQFTMARMLGAPISRWAPAAGKSLAAAAAAITSFAVLVIASVLTFSADWGPPLGIVLVGLALAFAAIGIGFGIASFAATEESVNQIVATATTSWAVIGGVFLVIPPTGLMHELSMLSPFSWALSAIGLNAGSGTIADVALRAGVIALFGVAGFALAWMRRSHLRRI